MKLDAGAGLGFVSAKTTTVGLGSSERESNLGLSLKFNIGVAFNSSLEVYLANHITFQGTGRQGANQAIRGWRWLWVPGTA